MAKSDEEAQRNPVKIFGGGLLIIIAILSIMNAFGIGKAFKVQPLIAVAIILVFGVIIVRLLSAARPTEEFKFEDFTIALLIVSVLVAGLIFFPGLRPQFSFIDVSQLSGLVGAP